MKVCSTNMFNVNYENAVIILECIGVWLSDLTVTQTFQEEVEENQRGIVNGVQESLNKIMELTKFGLVILFPSPETFGYLIILSWIFVVIGLVQKCYNFNEIINHQMFISSLEIRFSSHLQEKISKKENG